MKRIVTLLALLLAANWTALRASAEDGEVATLFLKNNGELTGHIWVNGRYQGYVSPGKARYTVREGFVTRDSGVQPDGSVKQTWAQGGWDSKSPIKVRIVEADNTNWFDTTIEVTGDDQKKGYVWFGEKNSGSKPDNVVWEQANQIPNGVPPVSHPAEYAVKAETEKAMSLAGTVWKITYEGGYTLYRFNANGDYCYKPDWDLENWYCGNEELQQTWRQSGTTVTWQSLPKVSGPMYKYEAVVKGQTMSGTQKTDNRDAQSIKGERQ